jgi:hypothetical protein
VTRPLAPPVLVIERQPLKRPSIQCGASNVSLAQVVELPVETRSAQGRHLEETRKYKSVKLGLLGAVTAFVWGSIPWMLTLLLAQWQSRGL